MARVTFSRIQMFLNGETSCRKRWPRVEIVGSPLFSPQNHFVVVDGGLRQVSERNFSHATVRWIGDGDSLEPGALQAFERLVNLSGGEFSSSLFPSDKDLSDCALALQIVSKSVILDQGVLVEVFGACGGRWDHALITYQELVNWVAQSACPTTVVADFGLVTNQAVEVFLQEGSVFSILASESKTLVNVVGGRYAGKLCFSRPSSGLSNEVKTSPVALDPRSGAAILLWNLDKES
jgi:thiamine pyrophosphokinase